MITFIYDYFYIEDKIDEFGEFDEFGLGDDDYLYIIDLWVEKNCSSIAIVGYNENGDIEVTFDNKADAIKFKMVWG